MYGSEDSPPRCCKLENSARRCERCKEKTHLEGREGASQEAHPPIPSRVMSRRPLAPLQSACVSCGCAGRPQEEQDTDPCGSGPEVKDFKCSIWADGSGPFPVEGSGRYVLYVAAGCPFAARPWIIAEMTGLSQKEVPIIKVFPGNSKDGWFFVPGNEEEERNATGMRGKVEWHEKEPVGGFKRLRDLYNQSCQRLCVQYTGAITAPVLFDTKKGVIVSNDSIDISWILAVEMASLHSAAWKAKGWDLFPEEWDQEHGALIKETHLVNTGVYAAHFAPDQSTYEDKLYSFWEKIGSLDRSFSSKHFMLQGVKSSKGRAFGCQPVFADIMLFATTLRVDIAYGPCFRVGMHLMRDFDNMWAFTRRMYSILGVTQACDIRGIQSTYATSFPLRTKAGLTVPPTPPAFDQALKGHLPHKQRSLLAKLSLQDWVLLSALLVAFFSAGFAAAAAGP